MDIDDLEQDVIRLSRKHGISKKEVIDIWNYQFKTVMKLIKIADEEGIAAKLRGLGTFEFSEFKLKRIKENKYEREILSESTPEDGDRNQLD